MVSIGYNGGASGQENECESKEPGQCGHLHAEENAIINCDVPRGTPKIVFCTDLPCAMCAKRLVNLGTIDALYYQREYRRKEGLDILRKANIDVVQYLNKSTIQLYDEEIYKLRSEIFGPRGPIP